MEMRWLSPNEIFIGFDVQFGHKGLSCYVRLSMALLITRWWNCITSFSFSYEWELMVSRSILVLEGPSGELEGSEQSSNSYTVKETMAAKMPSSSSQHSRENNFRNTCYFRWRAVDPHVCELCPKGYYGSTSGLTDPLCTAACPIGTYNDKYGAQTVDECIDCPAGYFGSLTGQTDRGVRKPTKLTKKIALKNLCIVSS